MCYTRVLIWRLQCCQSFCAHVRQRLRSLLGVFLFQYLCERWLINLLLFSSPVLAKTLLHLPSFEYFHVQNTSYLYLALTFVITDDDLLGVSALEEVYEVVSSDLDHLGKCFILEVEFSQDGRIGVGRELCFSSCPVPCVGYSWADTVDHLAHVVILFEIHGNALFG